MPVCHSVKLQLRNCSSFCTSSACRLKFASSLQFRPSKICFPPLRTSQSPVLFSIHQSCSQSPVLFSIHQSCSQSPVLFSIHQSCSQSPVLFSVHQSCSLPPVLFTAPVLFTVPSPVQYPPVLFTVPSPVHCPQSCSVSTSPVHSPQYCSASISPVHSPQSNRCSGLRSVLPLQEGNLPSHCSVLLFSACSPAALFSLLLHTRLCPFSVCLFVCQAGTRA